MTVKLPQETAWRVGLKIDDGRMLLQWCENGKCVLRYNDWHREEQNHEMDGDWRLKEANVQSPGLFGYQSHENAILVPVIKIHLLTYFSRRGS